jgi:excisionase family DNA binding protein
MKPPKNHAVNETIMLSIQDVARLMQCSDRHVNNLRKSGRMPQPVKLGTLVRWPQKTIEEWIQAGCPVVAMLNCSQPSRSCGADSG